MPTETLDDNTTENTPSTDEEVSARASDPFAHFRVAPPPPEDFLWYMDDAQNHLVTCFAFGTGAGEPTLAPIGRQLAESLATILCLRDAFITVPQVFVTRGQQTPTPLRDDRIQSAFAVFYSLPETRLVRKASRRLGARFALTGRIIGEGSEFLLGANLLDVERVLLLGSVQRQCPREALLEGIAELGAYFLGRFTDTPHDTLRDNASRAPGTLR